MHLIWPQRVSLANLPTPIQPLPRWSKEVEGPRLWVKRDDLTGMELSGNKVRKLEFVAQAALEHRADVLITCGAVQSNHARATTVVASRLGKKAHLLLRGEKPADLEGNYFLDLLLGAEISFISAEDYRQQRQEIMQAIADDYARKGLAAWVIPEGASDALGAFGYAKAVQEIIEQSKILGIQFDAIVCAVGSGGTQAGLILGKKIAQWETEIVGINICDDALYFSHKIADILKEVRQLYYPTLEVTSEDIHIIDGYIGDGYGKARPEELDTLIRLARCEGIVLDPVYTGKAMHGLVQEIGKGRFAGMKELLFLHSGGLFGLLALQDAIRPLLDTKER